MGCDGVDTLHQTMAVTKTYTVCQQQQIDQLCRIQWYVRASKIEYLPLHIRGYHDSKKDLADLSRLEILNVKVDT